MSYQANHSFEDRKKEADRLRKKHPDRAPLIFDGNIDIPFSKMLVPSRISWHELMMTVRRKFRLDSADGYVIFVQGKLTRSSDTVAYIYDKFKSADGLLYVTLCKESVFGLA